MSNANLGICPVHQQTDCSPLLNGCTRLTEPQHHADEIAAVLNGLTDRERALVREAAVMGFVRGSMFGSSDPGRTEMPRDSRVLAEVIGACLSFPDLYPTLTGWEPSDDD